MYGCDRLLFDIFLLLFDMKRGSELDWIEYELEWLDMDFDVKNDFENSNLYFIHHHANTHHHED